MDRRNFLSIASVTVATGFVSGCSQLLGSDDVDLTIENVDDQSHEYSIVASGDFEEKRTEGSVAADESTTVSDFIPRLDYTHVATLAIQVGGEQVREEAITVNSSEGITVEITAPDQVTIRPKDVISPTGSEGGRGRTTEDS